MTERVIPLVEDIPDDEALTRRALERDHILNDIVVARDGAGALEWLPGDQDGGSRPRSWSCPNLHLPRVDELELLRRMRADERTRFVPVVVLTSSKEKEDVIASHRFGANAYVRKPVKFADFAKAVQALGVFWLPLNERPPDFASAPNRGT